MSCLFELCFDLFSCNIVGFLGIFGEVGLNEIWDSGVGSLSALVSLICANVWLGFAYAVFPDMVDNCDAGIIEISFPCTIFWLIEYKFELWIGFWILLDWSS